MTKEDMILLIEISDDLCKMDQLLEKLTGLGYANGDFIKLGNIYEVIRHNSHSIYQKMPTDKSREASYNIIMDTSLTVEKRADLLLHGRKKEG